MSSLPDTDVTLMMKDPSRSVDVPVLATSENTDTPISGSLVSLSIILPLIVVWAKAEIEQNKTAKSRKDSFLLMIISDSLNIK